MLQTEQHRFEAERLLEHLVVLCEQIGTRPPTSRQERRAAEYVRQILETLGIEQIDDHFFASAETLGWNVIPYVGVQAIAPLLGGTFGKLLGAVALLGVTKGLLDAARMRKSPFGDIMAQGASQNVIARVPPSGALKQRLYVIAHLDSGKQRLLMPLPVPQLTKPVHTLGVALAALSAVTMLLHAVSGRKKPGALQVLTAAAGAMAVAGYLYDEAQPHVQGANDNASGVAAALGIAEALSKQPLQHTEVNLLFTGCASAGSVGIETFLRDFSPPLNNSYFINLDMVGTGHLCYVTQHGYTYTSSYRPGPRITAMAAKVAREHPYLRVAGKDLLTLEEMARLAERGYEAITISASDEQGNPPHQHRLTDTLDKIESDTLTRAARYTWLLMQALDGRTT